MKVKAIIKELERKYPGKLIIENKAVFGEMEQ